MFAVVASFGRTSDGLVDCAESTYNGNSGIRGWEMSGGNWSSRSAPNLRCHYTRCHDHVARGWDHVPFLYGSSCCACLARFLL